MPSENITTLFSRAEKLSEDIIICFFCQYERVNEYVGAGPRRGCL
jgi:hypothetical protein